MPKQAARGLLASRMVVPVWRSLPGGGPALFTLHRFAMPDRGIAGHDPAVLAATLEALRRHRLPILSLREVLAALGEGRPLPRRGAVFTVDDGYADFAEVGAPIFQRYDVPVTVFLVTGFLDGATWLWWDQLRYLLSAAEGASHPSLPWRSRGLEAAPRPDRDPISALAAAATRLPDVELRALIRHLADRLGVPLPAAPPAWCLPMSWDAVRRLEGAGVTFGPHTVTHPILPNTASAHASEEIGVSWRRLSAEVRAPLPVLAYPNGDHGSREVELIQALGLTGAVTTVPGYVTTTGPWARFPARGWLPRFAYPDQPEAAVLTVSGFRLIQARGRGLPRVAGHPA